MSVLSIPSPVPVEKRARLREVGAAKPTAPAEALPRIDVVVAFWNEAKLIAPKVRNLLALDYPPELLRFIFVDGGSDDGSMKAAKRAARGDRRFIWLSCCSRGKTVQLNRAIQHTDAPWLLVTDADARLPSETLRTMIAASEETKNVGLVGVRCYPRHAIGPDRAHWSLWNAIRRMENLLGCATALGPCYMVRRSHFDGWAPGAVADDVFASLEINRKGARAILSDVLVIERRAPSAFLAFLWHKLRKARAVVREFVRFVPRSLEFGPKSGPIFLARAIALLLGPLALLAVLALLCFEFPLATGASLAALGLLAVRFGRTTRLPQRIARVLLLVLILSLVLAAAITTCAFVRPRPEFCRWKQEEL